jgi:hypothetical protein
MVDEKSRGGESTEECRVWPELNSNRNASVPTRVKTKGVSYGAKGTAEISE